MDESFIKNVMQTLPPSAQVKVIRDGLCEEDGTPSRSDVWSLLSFGSSRRAGPFGAGPDRNTQRRHQAGRRLRVCISTATRPPKTRSHQYGGHAHGAAFNPMQPMNQFADPHNTTVLVGSLSGYVTEDELRYFFQGFGEIRYLGTRVKIPPGKGGGFVQFVHRHAALPRWRPTRCRFSPGAAPRTTLAGPGCLRWLGDDVRNMSWGERWERSGLEAFRVLLLVFGLVLVLEKVGSRLEGWRSQLFWTCINWMLWHTCSTLFLSTVGEISLCPYLSFSS
jgi:hypothetical protein